MDMTNSNAAVEEHSFDFTIPTLVGNSEVKASGMPIMEPSVDPQRYAFLMDALATSSFRPHRDEMNESIRSFREDLDGKITSITTRARRSISALPKANTGYYGGGGGGAANNFGGNKNNLNDIEKELNELKETATKELEKSWAENERLEKENQHREELLLELQIKYANLQNEFDNFKLTNHLPQHQHHQNQNVKRRSTMPLLESHNDIVSDCVPPVDTDCSDTSRSGRSSRAFKKALKNMIPGRSIADQAEEEKQKLVKKLQEVEEERKRMEDALTKVVNTRDTVIETLKATIKTQQLSIDSLSAENQAIRKENDDKFHSSNNKVGGRRASFKATPRRKTLSLSNINHKQDPNSRPSMRRKSVSERNLFSSSSSSLLMEKNAHQKEEELADQQQYQQTMKKDPIVKPINRRGSLQATRNCVSEMNINRTLSIDSSNQSLPTPLDARRMRRSTSEGPGNARRQSILT